jgi:hypothetical protein
MIAGGEALLAFLISAAITDTLPCVAYQRISVGRKQWHTTRTSKTYPEQLAAAS